MFNKFLVNFKKSQIWKDMEISENSQWHRESSVCVHTMMTLDWYDNLKERSDKDKLLTKLALLFHDTGKPQSKRLSKDESRFIYAGHELISARIFEDYMISNHEAIEMLGLSIQDLRRIKWLIENHLPYDVIKEDKMKNLIRDLLSQGFNKHVFFDMLLSDANGRISDDHQKKILGVRTWIENLALVDFDDDFSCSSKKELHILIGSSGIGKSTFARSLKEIKDSYHFSLDELRLDFYELQGFYTINYKLAHTYCCENDKAFTKYFQSEFTKVVKNFNSIILDNINTSAKSRRYWITLAKQHGFKIISYEFMINLETVIERQHTRSDKFIPAEAVAKHYFSTSTPRIGSEVDEVNIVLYGKAYPFI